MYIDKKNTVIIGEVKEGEREEEREEEREKEREGGGERKRENSLFR